MSSKRIYKFLLGATVLLQYLPSSYAGAIDLYHQKELINKQASFAPSSVQEGYFKQYIDHNNPSAGTYSQRFFIDESYGKKANAPVFLYICGESTCSKGHLSGAIRLYAKKYHAKLVALEHRYYGNSLPRKSLSAQDLKDLTTQAALKDLARFQQTMSKNNNWSGKWVAFGGSYPGSLSAYYRLQYPQNVVGSLASSAPVMAKEDFYEYDGHVTQVAGPECASKMRQVVSEIEAAMQAPDKSRFEKIKKSFAAQDVRHDIDFLYLVADVGAEAIQYGNHDTFCSALATQSSPLKGYAEYARSLFSQWGVNAVDLTAEGAMSEEPDTGNGVGYRQWLYQSCTEYGYWQNAHPDSSRSTRSAFIDLDYHHQICKRLFGLDAAADTNHLNNRYYFPLLNPVVSNIYFTNGSNDPWSNLSLIRKNGNTTNPNLSYSLIQGAAHCDDLRQPTSSDSKALKLARKKTFLLLDQWLHG